MAFVVSSAAGQTPVSTDELPASRAVAIRGDLEAKLREIDQIVASPGYSGRLKAVKRSEGEQIRRRLRDGDFQTGDQIFLAIVGEQAVTDSFTVTPNRSILIPTVAEIQLGGVLRSELNSYLVKQLSRYFRQPTIVTKAYIRLAVLGEVSRPGFYQLPADEQLSQAIMLAGGPTANTKMSSSKVLRAEQELWAGESFGEAITKGTTLDQFNLQAGDEIRIGRLKSPIWSRARDVLFVVTSVISLGLVATRVF